MFLKESKKGRVAMWKEDEPMDFGEQLAVYATVTWPQIHLE
jgi:hypothetical protein